MSDLNRKAALSEIAFCISQGVDLGDEERSFVRAAVKTLRQAELSDEQFSALIDAIGKLTVYHDYVDDKWELIPEAFLPEDL